MLSHHEYTLLEIYKQGELGSILRNPPIWVGNEHLTMHNFRYSLIIPSNSSPSLAGAPHSAQRFQGECYI